MSKPKVCPKVGQHTPCPDNNTAWLAWWRQKVKTHRQVLCVGCGLYLIWVKSDGATKP